MDREKFISQLPITEKNIDKQWIMNVMKQSVDSNLHDGNPRGHRNLIIVMEEHELMRTEQIIRPTGDRKSVV